MTREEWLKIKKMEVVPREVWHSFYLEKGGKITDQNEFWGIFKDLINGAVVLGTDGKDKRISVQSAARNLFNYYDLKFGTYEGE